MAVHKQACVRGDASCAADNALTKRLLQTQHNVYAARLVIVKSVNGPICRVR